VNYGIEIQRNWVSLGYIPPVSDAVKRLLQSLKKGQPFLHAWSHKTGHATVLP